MARLSADDVACWVFKSTVPGAQLDAGWRPGTARSMTRCVRPSYRLDLMAPGQPCLLWVSGRSEPGVHALGSITGVPRAATGGPVVPVEFTLLPDPLPRPELLLDPVTRDAEVLRMPAGSNPSWLSAPQFGAVLDRVGIVR